MPQWLAAILVVAILGGGWWWSRARTGRMTVPAWLQGAIPAPVASPMTVLARSPLSPGATAALIEADGRRFLVVVGAASQVVDSWPVEGGGERPSTPSGATELTPVPSRSNPAQGQAWRRRPGN